MNSNLEQNLVKNSENWLHKAVCHDDLALTKKVENFCQTVTKHISRRMETRGILIDNSYLIN